MLFLFFSKTTALQEDQMRVAEVAGREAAQESANRSEFVGEREIDQRETREVGCSQANAKLCLPVPLSQRMVDSDIASETHR